jgi:hypothetical protein
MKKIILILAVATLSLAGCNRKAGEAQVGDEEAGALEQPGSDSANKLTPADTPTTDGYKADSITQTYPIPR